MVTDGVLDVVVGVVVVVLCEVGACVAGLLQKSSVQQCVETSRRLNPPLQV